jgi:hypothetical protein
MDKQKKDELNQVINEKKITSIIAGKILDYKSNLDAVPIRIIPITKSEQDREEVNSFYHNIELTSTQLLDSKFYSQVIKMNKERDRYFLKEGTTRKERISILAHMITRVTTPILFLNHKRNISLSNFYLLDEKKEKKVSDKEFINLEDPVAGSQDIKELTELDVKKLKETVLEKITRKIWKNMEELKLTSWEADILSQLTRDEEITIIIEPKSKKISFVMKKDKKGDNPVMSFLIEPETKEKEINSISTTKKLNKS